VMRRSYELVPVPVLDCDWLLWLSDALLVEPPEPWAGTVCANFAPRRRRRRRRRGMWFPPVSRLFSSCELLPLERRPEAKVTALHWDLGNFLNWFCPGYEPGLGAGFFHALMGA
jgi:hypothetical protein